MKTDEELQIKVHDAIKLHPLLQVVEIQVIVKDGIIILNGTVNTYSQKTEAENVTKSIVGIKTVITNIIVKDDEHVSQRDSKIALKILKALSNDWSVPINDLKVQVKNSWVTLEGELLWNFQIDATKNMVDQLTGIKGVTNNIMIKLDANNIIEKREVEVALARNSSINAQNIYVTASGSNIILTGKVTSLCQKKAAGRIACSMPGVWTVENKLKVHYNHL